MAQISNTKSKSGRPEQILGEAMALLKQKSPGMSLRAVAHRLQISPSYWSKVLRGEKPLSAGLFPRIVSVLGLDRQQAALLQRALLEDIENDHLASATGFHVLRKEEGSPTKQYKSLGPEDFWILEKWYIIPILNILTIEPHNGSLELISKRLKVPLLDVEEVIQKLLNAGILYREQDGSLSRSERKVRFPTNRSHPQIRKYHRSMIKKAYEEISRSDSESRFDSRLISSVCFSGGSEKLKEAKLIIEEALYKAANILAEAPLPEEVYQLNIQLFPLTK